MVRLISAVVVLWLVAASVAGCSSGSPRSAADTAPLRVLAARDHLMIGSVGALDPPERSRLAAAQFSGVSFETEFLFSSVHPAPDRWEVGPADRLLDFAKRHHQTTTATHFFWDPPGIRDVLPDWIRAIQDPAALLAAMRDHFTFLHDRYRGRIDRWDAVNEPLATGGGLEPANHFFEVLGPGWVAEALRMAKEVWPEAEMVLNESLTEYLPGKAASLVQLVTDLKAQGVPLDRVGLQAHLTLGEPKWALLASTMRQLTALGVAVDITELDVPLVPATKDRRFDEATQARWAARVVRTCLDVPRCGSVTFWGLDDGHTWLDRFIEPGTDPLLYDARLRPKPMYEAVRAELAKGRPR